MKKENGITLIALVITIIVLLILAGISIAMLTGENGILSKATKAGTETILAEQKEQVALAVNALTTEYYDDKYVSNKTLDTDVDTLEKYVIAGLTKTDGQYNVGEFVEFTAPAAGATTLTMKTKAKDNQGRQHEATYNGSKLSWEPVETPAGS